MPTVWDERWAPGAWLSIEFLWISKSHGTPWGKKTNPWKRYFESDVLKAKNVEVGVMIGDDDSSTIAACRKASDHDILKQYDKNHASGGVKKQLYGL